MFLFCVINPYYKNFMRLSKIKNIKLTRRFWSSLLFKLALTFALLTFLTTFILTLANYHIEYLALQFSYQTDWTNESIVKDSAKLANWLEVKPLNATVLQDWLRFYQEKIRQQRGQSYVLTYTDLENYTKDEGFFEFVIFDEKGNVVATSNEIEKSFTPTEKSLIDKVLLENADEAKSFDVENQQNVLFAVPIKNDQNKILGGFFGREKIPLSWKTIGIKGIYDYFVDIVTNLWALLIFGFILGFPVARHATRRLRNISFATEKWGKGDFSNRVNDKSSDELGILSRRLNEMADDLRENFALRKTIATAEERNRIARDLHDSVKQQVFGLAMQISTASALVEKNPESAKNFLNESENLIKEIQTELVDMIHKFSLPAKESETFKQKLENLVKDWTRQNVIKTEIIVTENLPISPNAAQTFYRITQETLSNIARHSEATEVKISLKNTGKKIYMSIADNGCGFETEKAKKGFGLQSIRERAESLPNGWLKIESKANVGTTIEVGCEQT
jgi:signal transduction histidine kinase